MLAVTVRVRTLINNREGKMNCGIVITARVKSKRLKEKVLQEIRGRTMIEILIDHLIGKHHFLDNDYQIVLAIPENKDDDELQSIGENKGIEVYRGEDDSPFHRLLAVAEKYEWDHVVRITADDILIDSLLLRNQIQFHIKGGQDYTFLKRCPEGVAGEVIKVKALRRAVEKVGNKPVEHTSYYLKTKDFQIREYYSPPEYQFSFRCTVDYEEDLLLLKVLHTCLRKDFGTLDLINFLDNHKYLMQINHLPKVTVYTCNYNYSPYIVQCLNSILAQTFQDTEIIILDDFSTDDSINKIVEWYTGLTIYEQKKIKIIRNDKNLGLPTSCNKVLDMARGRFILRIDSDDYLESTAIEKMVEEIEINEVEGIICGYRKVDFEGRLIEEITENHYHPSGCLLNRWFVNELKYNQGMEFYEGVEFFERFNELYNIKFIPEILWNYRQHDDQKSDEKNREARQEFKKEHNLKSISGSTTSQ